MKTFFKMKAFTLGLMESHYISPLSELTVWRVMQNKTCLGLNCVSFNRGTTVLPAVFDNIFQQWSSLKE